MSEQAFIPYSCQQITQEDIEAVQEALASAFISQGPILRKFEVDFAQKVEAPFAVGYSSGTAALHGMCMAAGFKEGDEVIVPALTFAGTSNAVLYTGAKPIFADIDPVSLCLAPDAVEACLSPRTRAILTVDFAGHPSPYRELRALADQHQVLLLSDAAHAPGGRYWGKAIGSDLADMTAFSFNPVKNMTTAEGGMVTTHDAGFASRLHMARSHGMTREEDLLVFPSEGGWYYEQQFLGFNYKLSELAAALGIQQLKRLEAYNNRRREIAALYTEQLRDLPLILPSDSSNGFHTRHLYPIRLRENAKIDRANLFKVLQSQKIGVQVHYIPVPYHPYYRGLGYQMEQLSETEKYYRTALSIPLHPSLKDIEIERVINALRLCL
ncbi:MAG: UDP-4-amino-4,6-dideoxy-N-acetyl-beta-L-altrosamine transaminase [Bacteroidetes Order II. Incertae sedis bacterium]|nr:UDP-4-amino-4,6-dideoxy-N-acetyl-beta-L-altrosamine transaminase [Bacteroidetes Order II. bacterium]